MYWDIEKMKAFANSEEGEKLFNEFVDEIAFNDELMDRWCNRFITHLENKSEEELNSLFLSFLAHSEKRRDILYRSNIDGQTDLYEVLLEAFKKLGVEADENAYTDFSTDIYDWKGYRIEMYCGQGCFYNLSKI